MDKPEPTTLQGVNTLAYHVLIRPGQVWKVSKYFLRRWSAYLTPSQVWLIIGARQFSYLNDRQPWFDAYDASLAAAAGVHVKVFRRTTKQEIVDGSGPISAFIARERESRYRHSYGVTRQTAARYTIRLDDPLTPADANHLAGWLRSAIPPSLVHNLSPDALARVLDVGRLNTPESFHAPDLAPVRPEREGMHSVADIVEMLFPHLANQYGWREAAEALHLHITSPDIAHYDTQYFRLHWLPILGPGPALLLVHLRSLCYHNEQTGELRDRIRLTSGDLEQRLQICNRTLRRWFDRLDEISAEHAGGYLGPFLHRLDIKKLSNQQVAYQFWVNLKTPIAPIDHSAYENLLRQSDKPFPATLPVANGQTVPHTSPADGQEVPHTPLPNGQTVPHTPAPGGQKVPHTPPANGHKVPHDPPGDGQQIPGRRTEHAPIKLPKTANGRKRPVSNKQQLPPVLTAPPDSLAAAAGPLPTLLEQLGIQEPTRGRLVQLNPPLEYVVAWYLYAGQEPGLQRPLPYVVNRLTAGDPPPDPYLRLARLERDKWRQFAAAYHFRHQLPLDQWQPFTGDSSDFNLWLDYFAAVPLEDLPFDIGLNLQPPEAPPPPAEAQAPPATPAAASSAAASSAAVSEADQQIWRETCRALRGQMDPATFNAWLRDATLLKRAGPLFTIGVRNEAARQWVAGRLLSPIRLTLTALTGHPIDLEVTINSHDAILSSGDTSLRQPTFRT